MTDAEVAAPALADPDARPATPEFWREARISYPVPKDAITIRVDRDVLDWFKAEGRGYQTRMNAVLRAFVEERRKRAG
jgi:uncharacterized protein (DUF4415 family)